MSKPRRRKKKAVLRRRSVLYLAILLAAVVVSYFFWVRYYVLPPDGPADFLPGILEEQKFTLNAGLSDLYQPGDVIQVADESGEVMDPYLRAADCFDGLTIQESDFALPVEMSGDAGAALRLTGKGLGRFLPKLGIENETAGRYRLELDRPRLLVVRRSDLSRRFSSECVARLNEAQNDGDRLEWYEIVHQAVVADHVRLEVEFSTASSAEAQFTVDRSARSALGARGDLSVSDDGKTKKLYTLGRTVLGYKTRPLAPFVAAVPSPSPSVAGDAAPPLVPVSGRLRVLAVAGRSARAVGLDHAFSTDDWFRFAIRAESAGWLYVFHRPPGGELAQLWPPADGSGSNALVAGTEVTVPPRPHGWHFVETTGEEYFYVAITSETRPPEVAGPTAGAPAEVVNYIVRGLARNVELGTVPGAVGPVTTAAEAIELVASDGGTVAAVEFRLRHE